MKTVFVCRALNMRVEGLVNRAYSVDERINIKHQGRWLVMVVEEIRENGDLRQVMLRPVRSAEGNAARRQGERRKRPPRDPGWIDDMVDAIDGESGPVCW